MNSTIRVMIVDDHDMVRMGLKTYIMLDPKLEVCAEASDGRTAIALLEQMAEEERPQVILMDLMMPNMDGIETTKEIIQNNPSIKVVMLTSFLEEDKVLKAIEAGATSYVLKTISSDQLLAAIHKAAQGIPEMNPEVSLALTRGLRQRNTQPDEEGLTIREKEVLLLVADGKTNKDIAEELHISIKTVKTHVSNLLMKCEVDDRTQLAIYAHRKGWVQGSF